MTTSAVATRSSSLVTRHSSLSPCPVFISGEWREISDVETTPVFNPSRGEIIAQVPLCGDDVVNEAVEAAAKAFPAWRDTPPVERARLFFRYRQLLEENFDRICESVSREHGKTLAEARGSAYRGIENVEYACSIPTLLMGDTLEELARGVDCETMHQPLGVCVGITPFNFPAMVPMWMFPAALACGNTFVLKPSEKVPLTSNLIIELLEKAGLPKGVLNIVHGGRECVDALLVHPKVKAISFVGSSPVAKHIYETGTRHGKRVQANGGAKNYIVVMPDADVVKTVEALSTAAFPEWMETPPVERARIFFKFKMLLEAGFEGVEPPSHMDQEEVLRAREATGERAGANGGCAPSTAGAGATHRAAGDVARRSGRGRLSRG